MSFYNEAKSSLAKSSSIHNPHPAVQVWARTTHGLEWIAAAEAELLSNIHNIRTAHRDLFFRTDNFDMVMQLRCIDDAYALWGEINHVDHTRLTLHNFTDAIRKLSNCPLSIPKNIKNLRVTASFLGKRNYSRYDLENLAGPILANKLNLKYIDSLHKDTPDAAWCRIHLGSEFGMVGIRTNPIPLHRRYWRTESMPGLLHPPIAAAMCMLANLQAGDTVMDPFVGTGTLLIEAGLRCPNLTLIGFDISSNALRHAQTQMEKANIHLNLSQADMNSSDLPMVDCIISNPPWGKQIELAEELKPKHFITKMLSHLKPNGRCVLIVDQEMKLPELLINMKHIPLLIETVRVSGKLSDLLVLGDSPLFTNTSYGSMLQKAQSLYGV